MTDHHAAWMVMIVAKPSLIPGWEAAQVPPDVRGRFLAAAKALGVTVRPGNLVPQGKTTRIAEEMRRRAVKAARW